MQNPKARKISTTKNHRNKKRRKWCDGRPTLAIHPLTRSLKPAGKLVFRNAMAQTDRHTERLKTDIAASRVNWPKGGFSENETVDTLL